jgi:hypothetical protein
MAELFEILGKGAMRLSTPATQEITDSAFTILEFDSTTIERGGVVCDPVTNSITVPSTGLYTVNHGVDANFPGRELLAIMTFVNGVEYDPNYLYIQGRANQKPVSISWQSTVTLNAGDVIDMRGMNGEAGSFDLNLHRMYLAIIKEH